MTRSNLFEEESRAMLAIGMDELEPGYLLEHALVVSLWKLQSSAAEFGIIETAFTDKSLG